MGFVYSYCSQDAVKQPASSRFVDGVLLVEGRQMHVNQIWPQRAPQLFSILAPSHVIFRRTHTTKNSRVKNLGRTLVQEIHPTAQ